MPVTTCDTTFKELSRYCNGEEFKEISNEKKAGIQGVRGWPSGSRQLKAVASNKADGLDKCTDCLFLSPSLSIFPVNALHGVYILKVQHVKLEL